MPPAAPQPAKLALNLQPPADLPVSIIPKRGGKELVLWLRPFVLSDEKWLADYLGDKDIFGLDDNEPKRAVAVFCRQLRPESFEQLRGLMKLPAGEDWDAIAANLCEKLSSESAQPLTQALMVMRAQCLPELPESKDDLEARADALGKLMWTGTLCFVCGCLAAWAYLERFSH